MPGEVDSVTGSVLWGIVISQSWSSLSIREFSLLLFTFLASTATVGLLDTSTRHGRLIGLMTRSAYRSQTSCLLSPRMGLPLALQSKLFGKAFGYDLGWPDPLIPNAPPYLFVYAMSSITRILELVDIHYQQRSVRPVEVRKETLFQTDFPIFLLPILALQDFMIY